MTGRSAVRLARVLREHEVGGSNPLAPIDSLGSLFDVSCLYSSKSER